jgi:hypothetical protein
MMTRPPNKPLPPAARLNFLLGASDHDLSTFELARLSEVANLRSDLHAILDKLIDEMSQAALVGWFRQTDRHKLKLAIEASPEENTAEILAWAKERAKNQQRSEGELVPRPALPAGAAHLAAALRYQERNIAEGKCCVCPKPLAPGSVRYCEKHLAMERARKPGKSPTPGSADWLYRDGNEITKGREPSNLARLEMQREKKTRAVLAELGIAPESAAVSLKAAKDALLKVMPDSKARAKSMAELFETAVVPSRTTGQKALRELLAEGKIQRTGGVGLRDVFRYFAVAALVVRGGKA